MTLTVSEYWLGRDIARFAKELTDEVRANALVVVERANALLAEFGEARRITSGWRPKAINAATPGAAPFSRHMTAQAIDLADPHGDLDEWCLDHPEVLERIGLWQEHPSATKSWCHLQIVPPKSGRRVFYP